METKFFEIRDSGTFIPAMATCLDGSDSWLALRAGFGKDRPYIILTQLEGLETQYDRYNWRGAARTMPAAHAYIEEHWDELKSGDLVDVRVPLGEATEPCKSERSLSEDDYGC